MNVTSVALEGVGIPLPRSPISRVLISQNASTLMMNAQTNARLPYRSGTAHPHQNSSAADERSMGATETWTSSLCVANIFDMLVLLLLAAALPSALPQWGVLWGQYV